jgi:hypothetical protein
MLYVAIPRTMENVLHYSLSFKVFVSRTDEEIFVAHHHTFVCCILVENFVYSYVLKCVMLALACDNAEASSVGFTPLSCDVYFRLLVSFFQSELVSH